MASLVLLPLIADRNEIRPEIFSYLFSAIFLWILAGYKEKRLSYKYLFALPILEIIWINLHVYFFVGIFLFGLFICCEMRSKFREKKPELRKILLAFFLTCAAALINPFGIKGLLYPLNIFKNYGYLIVENQSIGFLEKINFQNPNFIVFKNFKSVLICQAIISALLIPNILISLYQNKLGANLWIEKTNFYDIFRSFEFLSYGSTALYAIVSVIAALFFISQRFIKRIKTEKS